MKYLSHYVEKAQTEAFEKAGAFFAFSNSQFDEKKVEGVKYYNMGAGLICPKDTAKQLLADLDAIQASGIKQDLAENGKEGVIKRELNNHECYYTMDITDCVDKLKDYGITAEEILAVFKVEKATYEYVF